MFISSLSLTHIHTLLFTISQTFATNEGKWLEFETETEHFNFWLMYIWWLHVCVCVCIYLFMFSSWGESANPLYSMFSFNVFNIRLGKCASIVYVCVCGINDTTCVLFVWLWKKWNQLSQQTESRLAMTAVAISKMNDYSLYMVNFGIFPPPSLLLSLTKDKEGLYGGRERERSRGTDNDVRKWVAVSNDIQLPRDFIIMHSGRMLVKY